MKAHNDREMRGHFDNTSRAIIPMYRLFRFDYLNNNEIALGTRFEME